MKSKANEYMIVVDIYLQTIELIARDGTSLATMIVFPTVPGLYGIERPDIIGIDGYHSELNPHDQAEI